MGDEIKDIIDVLLDILKELFIDLVSPKKIVVKIVVVLIVAGLRILALHWYPSDSRAIPSPVVVWTQCPATVAPSWEEQPDDNVYPTPGWEEGGDANNVACGSSPRDLRVGHWAQVCTWSSGEPVRIRSGPSISFSAPHELNPGAVVKVIDGPVCDEESGWWFWKIETRTKHYIGWMAEGGDEKDARFLCFVH